jgi:predicted RNA binding protein YcfA (HicA-like mRNA interferase family)
MKSKELIKILKKDGWFLHHQKGSHCQFKHKTKIGKVTVPHPRNDFPIKTFKSILKQASIDI